MNDNDVLSLKHLNRTFIGSVLFVDIVGYSRRTVPEQIEMKELFNELLGHAVQNVARSERIMVDTGDGAAIAFLGDPEDALFTALSLRDAVDAGRVTIGEPGFVRLGINLGPLKLVRDINGHTNMIGDGVNDAQRVMSFAEPGQVMVSHSYYDIISRFSRDYTQLFVYEGTRHDKHVREHEVYRFGPPEDQRDLAEKLRDRSRARHADFAEAASVAPSVAMQPPASGGPAGKAMTAAAGKTAFPRTGMMVTAVCAVAITGTVWSWTSSSGDRPEVQQTAMAGAQSSSAAASGAVPLASTASAAQEKSGVGAKASGSASMPDSLPKSHASSSTPSPEGASPQKSHEDASAKPSDNPAAAAKPGTVKLAVQPWGEVYVDGSKRGVSPPLKSLSLSPGKHRIEIRNGEFAPFKESVDVKSGAEHTVQYMF